MIREPDDLDVLEDELRALFDETAFEPDQDELYDAARWAAQVPSEVGHGWAAWFRWVRLPAATCALLALTLFHVNDMASVSSTVDEMQYVASAQKSGVVASLNQEQWDDLDLLSAGDLGFELLDLPGADVDPASWHEAYEGIFEEI